MLESGVASSSFSQCNTGDLNALDGGVTSPNGKDKSSEESDPVAAEDVGEKGRENVAGESDWAKLSDIAPTGEDEASFDKEFVGGIWSHFI